MVGAHPLCYANADPTYFLLPEPQYRALVGQLRSIANYSDDRAEHP